MSGQPRPSDAEARGGEWAAARTLPALPAVRGWASSAEGLAVLWESGSLRAPSPHHQHQTVALGAGSPWQAPACSILPEPQTQH